MTTPQAADRVILDKLSEIMQSRAIDGAKLQMLDRLRFVVWNQHPLGMAADVLQNIADAERQVMYPETHV